MQMDPQTQALIDDLRLQRNMLAGVIGASVPAVWVLIRALLARAHNRIDKLEARADKALGGKDAA